MSKTIDRLKKADQFTDGLLDKLKASPWSPLIICAVFFAVAVFVAKFF